MRAFSDQLGAERSSQLTHMSADSADWIAPTAARAPQAVVCADPFHMVSGATEPPTRSAARSGQRTQARGHHRGQARRARSPFLRRREEPRSRYALWKNPEDLTVRQHAKLAWIAKTHPQLYRAYLLKEGLRTCSRSRARKARRH